SRCYRFDTWCTGQRETTRRLHIRFLAALVERLADDAERALRHARARLLLDPCMDSANIDVMRLLASLGRAREALEQYDACRRVLKRELGTIPSREMESLRRSLLPSPVRRATRTGRAAMHTGRAAMRTGRARTPIDREAAAPPARARTALIGRQREREVLEAMVSGTASDARSVLLVAGEPGIGKTRLLDELSVLTRAAGGMVITGRAYEAELLRPYGAWIDALRAIPSDDIPVALQPELAPLLPELGPAAMESADRTRLFDAIAELLEHCSMVSRRLAIVLDDIQWLDDASAALLHFVARRSTAGVIIACACRYVEIEDGNAASRLVRTLRSEDILREMVLTALDAEATTALVHAVAPDIDPDRVFAGSEGNPLFAIEMARTGMIDGRLPGTLSDLIDDRLRRLDPQAQLLVQWAAALGHDFDLTQLARVSQMEGPNMLRGIEQLERRGVLQACGARYDFAHDVIRQVAYQRISEPRRRLMHNHIAHALDEASDPDHELSGETARHAALGGAPGLAARAYLTAARRALWTFAPAEAAELVTRGLRQLDGLEAAVRLPVQLELLGLSINPGMREHRIADLEGELLRLVAEARIAGLRAEVYRGLQIISYIHFLAGDFGGALERSTRAQEAGRGADSLTVVRALGDAARCLGLLERDMPRARQLAQEAASLAHDIGYEGHELPQALGHVHHYNGELDDAVADFERAAHLARTERERWFECIALSRLVMIELERRQFDAARMRGGELLEVTRQMGEGSDGPFAEALQALSCLGTVDDDAVERLDSAIARLRDVDSRWMIAYVQNVAAWLDLDRGKTHTARQRAEEALAAAELVERRNEIAVARAMLARIAGAKNDRPAALQQIAGVRRDVTDPGVLSARARRAIAIATQTLGDHDTSAPAPGDRAMETPGDRATETPGDPGSVTHSTL
ncbi:MAG TPA: AAA family ATPase, partial [Longimicrobiales bacterium]|nr:AAA family ATPase [Longimicrobiales bacterium]